VSKNTIFVFTSDHGEMLGSQGQRPFEKQRPWDESIRVPFLLSYPAVTGQKGRIVRAPINTPDILPSLLSLSGVEIPASIEGEDLSGLITGKAKDEDRAALVMSVYPFAGYYGGKAFRGIRTIRYTYARSTDGPWLLYDNETDPYQMKNLIGKATHADLQKELEGKLQAKLTKTGDTFVSKQEYLKKWGYTVNGSGCIPYARNHTVQSPANKPR
jgi:arylsulfatase A-like enzyme